MRSQRARIGKVFLAAQTLLVWAAVSTKGSAGAMSPSPIDAASADFAQEAVEEINQARWENGKLPPLKRQEGLDAATAYHSQDMALDNYVRHDSYDCTAGKLVLVRPWSQRVGDYYSGWSWLGECIAAGYSTAESAVNGWLGSPGHRGVMLSANYTEIGVGYHYYNGSVGCHEYPRYGHYWTADFGSRSGVYPVVINREAATAGQREVALYLYGQGWASEMQFKNEGGEWSGWEPYSPDKAWLLSCGVGDKTVYAQLRNGGPVQMISDTISLDGEEYRLGVETEQLTFLYSMETEDMVPASSREVSIENEGVACGGLGWEATKTVPWLTLSPISGTTYSTLTITPTGFITSTPATYTGTVVVAAADPPGAAGSPQTIAVELVVAERVYQMFLPLTMR